MLYSLAKSILAFVFFLLGLKSEGTDNIPREGPVIIAVNHISNWDPVVVALVLDRPIHYIAKAELFKNKILGKLLIKLHAFPVNRGKADRRAIRQALLILEEGKILGIFPEGSRNKTGEDIKAQSGIALFALKSGAPIVPVACSGTRRSLPIGWLHPLQVKIGKAMYLEEYRGQKVNSMLLEEVSSKVMDEINSLLRR